MDHDAMSVFDLPFAERRYLAVLDNEEFDRISANLPPALFLDLLSDLIPLPVPKAFHKRIGDYLRKRLVEQYRSSLIGRSEARMNGKSLIKAIPLREAKAFKFLGGCAEPGKAYAANPLSDKTYYSVESYNDDMIDHKLSELERILNGLGARAYEIIFNSEEQLDTGFKAGFRKGVGGRAEIALRNARARRFERSGTSLGREPSLPSGLVWLDREPSWQALVESRLDHGRQDFALRVNLERDLQISATVTADFKLLRLDIGSDINKRINFNLHVKGSFKDSF